MKSKRHRKYEDWFLNFCTCIGMVLLFLFTARLILHGPF
jgi:hypothetical protein